MMEINGKRDKRIGSCKVGKRGIVLGWLVQPVKTDEERQAGATERWPGRCS